MCCCERCAICHLPPLPPSCHLPSCFLSTFTCVNKIYQFRPIQNLQREFTNSDPFRLSRENLPIQTHSDPCLNREYKCPAASPHLVSRYPSFIASTSHRENPNQRTRNLSARIQLTKGQHHQYLKEREDEDLFQYQRDLCRVKTYVEACFT